MTSMIGKPGIALVLGISVALIAVGALAAEPGDRAINGLAPCPSSPNCVSTPSEDKGHAIAPIPFEYSVEEAKARLLAVIRSLPRTRIVETDGAYVRVEVVSRIFRFVDDVEFYLDGDAGLIQFRSASRLGYSDLGANRRRMEKMRSAFSSATLNP